MTHKASPLLALFVLAAAVSPVPAVAGGFRVTDVSYIVYPIENND